MIVRKATENDIPAIVALLKTSLGESLMPKSEGYWRWKHIDNPFGPSPVLLAEDDGKIVGVRAFMTWQWEHNGDILRAVRAVDTATDPNHQGKGIFKKLTLAMVDECKLNGVHFIFNTPNTQSRPGYLKMGWEDAGRVPVQMTPIRILGMLKAALGNPSPVASAEVSNLLNDPAIDELIVSDKIHRRKIGTAYTTAYLKWRYLDVPVVKYIGFRYTNGTERTCVIGRIKPSRLGNEFRITDFFSSEATISSGSWKELKRFATQAGADYLTSSGLAGERLSFGMTLKQGPITTIRNLNLRDNSQLSGFNHWAPSLGDLELF
jgi:N-acetylglutamate synthase-like GNAT family acetyltransferase